MKTCMVVALIAGMDAARVPKNSPVRKVLKLKRFAVEWLGSTFGADSRITKHWTAKFARNVQRFQDRFADCPKTEEEFVAEVIAAEEAALSQDSRKRRSTSSKLGKRKGKQARLPKKARIPTEFRKFDRTNPSQGIHDITKGFALWAQRYVSECRGQPKTQADRAERWFTILNNKYESLVAKTQA